MMSLSLVLAVAGGLAAQPAAAITETRLLDHPAQAQQSVQDQPILAPKSTSKEASGNGGRRHAVLAEIPPAYWTVSADKRVPADLLYSISLQESKLSTNKGRIVPWP